MLSTTHRYITACLGIILLAFAVFLVFMNLGKPGRAPQEESMPVTVSSGRYPEFLKTSLKMEVRLEDKTVWIYLTNKSAENPIPSEEPHRTIVCSTDLFDENNNKAGSYHEYFRPKNPLEKQYVPSRQIQAGQTVKFAYDLIMPHGTARIRLTYEDFSKMWQSGSATLLLDEKEIKF